MAYTEFGFVPKKWKKTEQITDFSKKIRIFAIVKI